MNKKLLPRKCFVSLLLSVFLYTTCLSAVAGHDSAYMPLKFGEGTTLYVGGDGPGNYSTIMEAVYNASDGDTIFIYSGTYYEHVKVFKQLTIRGEDKETVVIDGNGTGEVVLVSVGQVVIESCSIVNGDMGVYLESEVCNTTIHDTIVTGHVLHGICVESSCDYNVIDGNRIADNGEHGIHLSGFNEYNSITNNFISDNKNGSQLQAFAYGEVTGNTFQDNQEYALCLMLWCNENKITRNNFINNNKDVLFFTSVLNTWLLNYWDRPRVLPKPIFGIMGVVPWLAFDWRPALAPYDYE